MLIVLPVSLSCEIYKETPAFEYKLRDDLTLEYIYDRNSKYNSILHDSNGNEVVDTENLDDTITKKYKKGDNVQLKIIDADYNPFLGSSNFKSVRVYILDNGKLIELGYKDISEQGIDELINNLFE